MRCMLGFATFAILAGTASALRPAIAGELSSRVYVLAGSENHCLDIYQKGQANTAGPETAPAGEEAPRG